MRKHDERVKPKGSPGRKAMVALLAVVLHPGISAESPGGENDLTVEQFLRRLRSSLPRVHDISFIYEGRAGGVPPSQTADQILSEGREALQQQSYQGESIVRHDGANRLDYFFDMVQDGQHLEWRTIGVTLGKSSWGVTFQPGRMAETPGQRAGSHTGCAEQFFFYSFLRAIAATDALGWRVLGSESLDGHACVKVSDGTGEPSRPGVMPIYNVYWVDLERGGNVLRMESFMGDGRIRARLVDVRLQAFKSPRGDDVWIPVHARNEVFPFMFPEASVRVVGFATYQVVEGSVRIDQGYGDEVFKIDWKRAFHDQPGLQARAEKIRASRRRTGPEGTRQHLAKALKEADAVSSRLVSTSPAHEVWTTGVITQAVLTAAGVATIVVALVIRGARR